MATVERRRISKPYIDARRPAAAGRWCINVREGALVRIFAGKTREEARRLAGLRPRKEGS